VSWQWSGGRPSGEVAEVVKEGEATVTSNRGNEIKKNADPEDPAVHISRPGNDVVKRAHELDVEEKASGAADGGEKAAVAQEKNDEDSEMKDAHEGEKNGDAKTGEKRDHTEAEDDGVERPAENGAKVHENGEKNGDKATEEDDDDAESEEKDDEPPAKKQKKDKADNAAEEKKNDGGEPAKKSRGRPKKSETNGEKKAAAKKREPKKAATASGELRRSSRHKV